MNTTVDREIALRETQHSPAGFDVARIRQDFPILSQTIRGKNLVFLDSGASAQKPVSVIEAMSEAMRTQYANVHRGLHWLSERTTEEYESTRDAVARLLGASAREEIVFTRNSTEAINLVAHSYGRGILAKSDRRAVLISEMEHHANIVPWQMLRDETGVELRIAPVTDAGELDMAAFTHLLSDGKVGLVAITHMSNVLGTYVPVAEVIALAHKHGAKVLLDGSQAVVHRRVDVTALDADFYVFTGHKLYGPTGIGVLWAKRELLEAMPPFMGGGDMIGSVTFEHSTWAHVPHKFEAGTPAIIEAIGLKAAIAYVEAIGYEALEEHEQALTRHALVRLNAIEGLRIIGQAADRGGVISFVLDHGHPHDVATLLDRQGIAVRAGHHCAEPLMRRLSLSGTARATFGVYNTRDEIDFFADTLTKVRDFLA
ncbi:Selenocysteine lyase [Granulibacter bethesdensis]|uniref:aminotransferase class V-fold PLP-dependent enzyme n=1 Tax=Granulibacter bethesdensis TaxID=364410 RepID=UPI000909EF62|nr:SufS family cysteine desulfurase [Granulibacter bethesdensis]APH57137.1 Selenocysteine lyase [Granulibacter bethesdensis]